MARRRRYTGTSMRRARAGGAAEGLFKLVGPKLRQAKRLPNARGAAPNAPARRRRQLDPAAWKQIENRRAALERKYGKDFDKFTHDPDRKGKVSAGSREEARTALDMREQGQLPRDIQRPTVAETGDFVGTVDGKKVHYDIKTFRDWFPGEGGDYRSPDFEAKITKQVGSNRVVILDTRDLKQWVLDDMVRVVNQRGWSRHVIWYP